MRLGTDLIGSSEDTGADKRDFVRQEETDETIIPRKWHSEDEPLGSTFANKGVGLAGYGMVALMAMTGFLTHHRGSSPEHSHKLSERRSLH